jgi:transcriptional regulator with XRE-family HTH domain
MLTEFGKMLRRIRLDGNVLLKDMSDKLNVTASYLSAVEHGKREIPVNWVNLISNIYHLDDDTTEKLHEAAEMSRLSLKMDLKGYSSDTTYLANAFARKLKDFNKSEIEQMMKIINGKEKE